MNVEELEILLFSDESVKQKIECGSVNDLFYTEHAKIEIIKRIGGSEDDGIFTAIIFKVNDKQYFQVDGEYDSWEGTIWNWISTLTEVKPTEETIIFYKPIQ